MVLLENGKYKPAFIQIVFLQVLILVQMVRSYLGPATCLKIISRESFINCIIQGVQLNANPL